MVTSSDSRAGWLGAGNVRPQRIRGESQEVDMESDVELAMGIASSGSGIFHHFAGV